MSEENRYNAQGHYLPAVVDVRPTSIVDQRPAMADLVRTLPPVAEVAPMPTNSSEDAAALRSLATATETSTPVGRSVATNIRAAGLLVAVGLVCLALRWAGAPAALSAIGFACLLVAGYVWIVRLDHQHSPAGVERRKVDSYEAIRLAEIEAQRAMGVERLRVYERILDKVYKRDGNQ